MQKQTAILLGIALLVGIGSGLLWFRVGEILDNTYGNFLSWFVCPAIVLLGPSILICFLGNQENKRTWPLGIFFFVIAYTAHWIPYGSAILFFTLSGGF
jgi:hypothetical protein